jgi:hypothetical protein
MRRLHPELFDKKHPNPWDDFTLKSRTKTKKHAVTREEDSVPNTVSCVSAANFSMIGSV